MSGPFGGGEVFDGRDPSGFESLGKLRSAPASGFEHDGDNSDVIPESLYGNKTRAESDEAFDMLVSDGRHVTDVSPMDVIMRQRHPSAHRLPRS